MGLVDTNMHFLDIIRFLQVKKVILGELEGKGTEVWEMSVIHEKKKKKEHLTISIILSTFLILFIKKLIIIVFKRYCR